MQKIRNLIKLQGYLGRSNYNISCLKVDQLSVEESIKLTEQLQQFESTFTYPFDKDHHFRIQHGRGGDYFSFFKSLGEPYFFIATCRNDEKVDKNVEGKQITIERKQGEIAGVGCAILRTLPTNNSVPIKTWYLCDLKVGEKYQGEHLLSKFINKYGFKLFWKCPRGFAICMKPAIGNPKAAEIWKKHSPIKGSTDDQTLHLYSLPLEELQQKSHEQKNKIQAALGIQENTPFRFTSTQSIKDYKIFNTNNPLETTDWELFHADPEGKQLEGDLRAGNTCMFTAMAGTDRDKIFQDIFGNHTSEAVVVEYGQKVDFTQFTSNQI